jgi:hypothetical protein
MIANADIVGEDVGGRPVRRFEVAWLVDKLASLNAVTGDLEQEPDAAWFR